MGVTPPLTTPTHLLSEAQRDIHQKSTYDLADAGLEGIHLSFYLTSIYDHSIFEVCLSPSTHPFVCLSVCLLGFQSSGAKANSPATHSGELVKYPDIGEWC